METAANKDSIFVQERFIRLTFKEADTSELVHRKLYAAKVFLKMKKIWLFCSVFNMHVTPDGAFTHITYFSVENGAKRVALVPLMEIEIITTSEYSNEAEANERWELSDEELRDYTREIK